MVCGGGLLNPETRAAMEELVPAAGKYLEGMEAVSPASGDGQAKACPTMLEAAMMLRGNRCSCHKIKVVKQAFCGDCFHALPPAMQKALYKRLGKGFEQAYQAAKDWLLA
jgi:hypothetical protein